MCLAKKELRLTHIYAYENKLRKFASILNTKLITFIYLMDIKSTDNKQNAINILFIHIHNAF